MRLPQQLVELGLGLELDCDTWEWTWNLTDKMRLYSNPAGNKLVLLYFPKLGKRVKHPKKEKNQNFAKAKSLYGRFQGFKWDDISAYSIPDMDLKRIGRANYICYRSDKWGKPKIDYKHTFKCAPSVYVDEVLPHIIVISNPKLRVTRRGIEG